MGNSSSTSAAPASSERFVVAVDDSAGSVDTVSWAAKNLLNRGQEVHLVQVLDGSLASQADLNSGEGGILAGGKAEADAGTLATSRAYLAKIRDTLLAEGGVKPGNVKLVPLPSNTATSGDVGRTISDYAAQNKADAVVIGSRGLGAFRRRFLGMVGLGSVSDYVARHAPCTVFIHRPAVPLTQLLSLRQFLPSIYGALEGRGYAVVTTVGLVGRTGATGGEESESEGLTYDPTFRSPTEVVWPATKHQQRFASRLHHALETALLRNDGLRDTLVRQLGFAVQEVRMSPDNLKAYIQWDSVTGRGGELQRELRHLSPRLRSAVAAALRARNVPQLVFVHDHLTPRQQQIEDIFSRLDAEEAAAEAEAAGGAAAGGAAEQRGGPAHWPPGAGRDAGFASAVEASDEDTEEELEEEAQEEAGVAELERQRQEARRRRPAVG